MNAYKAIATRIVAAEERFIDYAIGTGLNRAEAIRAMATLRKAKALKIDAVGGQFTVTHGAFLEADVLKRAAAQ